MVALDRAVALSIMDGLATALEAVARLEADGRLTGSRYLPATKADLPHSWAATPKRPRPAGPPSR